MGNGYILYKRRNEQRSVVWIAPKPVRGITTVPLVSAQSTLAADFAPIRPSSLPVGFAPQPAGSRCAPRARRRRRRPRPCAATDGAGGGRQYRARLRSDGVVRRDVEHAGLRGRRRRPVDALVVGIQRSTVAAARSRRERGHQRFHNPLGGRVRNRLPHRGVERRDHVDSGLRHDRRRRRHREHLRPGRHKRSLRAPDRDRAHDDRRLAVRLLDLRAPGARSVHANGGIHRD